MNTKLKKNVKNWIVFVSTFPPRECGIATFTQDLTDAVSESYSSSLECKIVAMNVSEVARYKYPKKVIGEICQDKKEDYIEAAKKINLEKRVKMVSVQHEFGIYGADYGSNILLFLSELKKPAVVTFHTILPAPDARRLEVVKAIAEKSKGVVVMTKTSRDILKRDYLIDENKISVIPHGIHNVSYTTPEKAKKSLSLGRKNVLSTFGLLSRGKGLEFVIDAMPAVVEKFPNTIFLIVGETHPVVLKEEGESYRNFLYEKVGKLGLGRNVKFYNKYFGLEDLFKFLEATDIYISSSLDPNQAVSGTLSYALGSGRAVISTSFAQAKEDVAPEMGLLVDFKNPEAYSKAILKLLENPEGIVEKGKAAYFRTRHMTWNNVAISYMKIFSGHSTELSSLRKELPPIKLNHIAKLTDSFGMIQFAKLTSPDKSSGYTVDDNARALAALALYCKRGKTRQALKLLNTYLKFLEFTSSPSGYFENYVKGDRTINYEQNRKENMGDSSARALRALAQVVAVKCLPKEIEERARKLFEASFNADISFEHPRSWSFYIKALYLFLKENKNPKMMAILENLCDRLVALYESRRSEGWEWFEEVLTYSNGTLPEALLLGYEITGNKKYFEVGKKTLDFLISETFKDGIYIPIGQAGWYGKGGTRTFFDQQPEDVSSMVRVLYSMHLVSKEERYKKLMYDAFSWFLGNNLLGQVVYDRSTGGCYDGVGEKDINLNQGAESTVLYLLARLYMDE